MRRGYLGLCLPILVLLERGTLAQSDSPTEAASSVSVSASGGAAVSELCDSADDCHKEGVRLLRSRQTEAAISHFLKAVSIDDKSALYITDLGYAYLKQHRFVEAENAFRHAIVLDPKRAYAYEHLEQSITQQSARWEKRIDLLRILDRGVEVNRGSEAESRIALARIRAERSFGLFARARGHIEELLGEGRLTRSVEKQVKELVANIEQDKRALALRDWPEPEVSQIDRERLLDVEQRRSPSDRKEILATLTELTEKYPAWRAPRQLRAKLFSEQGHYDEAVKDLTVLTRLAPSEPLYHRDLGRLLAEHGGLLELDRADEALRTALALEPEWTELTELRKRLSARKQDWSSRKVKPNHHAVTKPTENALRLYNEAEAIVEMEPSNHAAAREMLEQALKESPGFIEASAALYSIDRRIREETVKALWNDADGMFALYQEYSRIDPDVPSSTLELWLNRAVELGHVEGRLSRALNKKNKGDKASAELELAAYLALVNDREEVEAVQLLRAELSRKPTDAPGQNAILNARLLLQQDDPAGALRALEAPCSAHMDDERLLRLGLVYERLAQNENAIGCYDLGLQKGNPGTLTAQLGRRLARVFARGDTALLAHSASSRLLGLTAEEPAAYYALARGALARGDVSIAEKHVARYLAAASPQDRFVADARAMERELLQKQLRANEATEIRRRQWQWGVGALVGVFLAVLYGALYRGLTVSRAIRRKPRLFPEVSRVIGQLRHDVLKHRTSALELLAHDETTPLLVRETMLEPMATSEVVTAAYAELVEKAQAEGIRLRRLGREPVFGSLVRDLRAVERALSGVFDRATATAVDCRLRNVHKARFDELLALGPRFRLDASIVQRWIAAVSATMVARGERWTVPALQMSDPFLELPIDGAALYQIFANLLRNAETATSELEAPRVQVIVERRTDFTGQPLVSLLIADNARTHLDEETVEAQAGDRGLGIVRDTARAWHGQVVINQEQAPYLKSVGVRFVQ